VALAFPTNLESDAVALRRFHRADAEWIREACDRPEMARFVPILPSPYTLQDAEAFIRYAEDAWEQESSAPFAITSLNGDPLGAIELHLNRVDRGHAGIGYWLRAEARGRGAATNALKLVSVWAFRDLHIERLSLITDPENEASQRVAERAGFNREGLLRAWRPTRNGRRDSVMFSLVRPNLPR
jgi:RimJ/RimL family protein N-acetyltransferase